jgi:uncharacterized protein
MFFYSFEGLALLVPAIVLAVWAQWKVKSTYAKYSKVGTRSGLSGAEVAQRILMNSEAGASGQPGTSGAPTCAIEHIAGEMTDHYDPRDHTLRLSQGVYGGRSIAALGIAAHEAGHAIQHANVYSPLMWRNAIYPISRIGSSLAFPLLFIGFIARTPMLIDVAIVLYIFAVFFTVITLPVEFNASRRAIRALSNGGYLTQDELAGAKKVLSAAAMTYVAAATMAIVQLIRMFLIRRD